MIQDTQQTEQFLNEHSYLLPLLDDARSHIARYFPHAPRTLELSTDPEAGTSDEQLVVHIGIDTSPADALTQLRQFDLDWWLNRVEQAKGKMIINLDLL